MKLTVIEQHLEDKTGKSDRIIFDNQFCSKAFLYIDNKRPLVHVSLDSKTDHQVIAFQLKHLVQTLHQEESNPRSINQDLAIIRSKLTMIKETLSQTEKQGMSENKGRLILEGILSNSLIRQNPRLFFNAGLVLVQLLDIYRSFNDQITVIRTLLEICRQEHDLEFSNIKMKLNRWLAKAYSSLGKHKVAVLYGKRALELAFLLKDFDSEIRLYDDFGKYYYYLDDLSRSLYFHKRTIDSLVEPSNSPVRELFLTRNKARRQRDEISESGGIKYRKPIQRADDKSIKISAADEHHYYYSSSDSEEMPMSQSVEILTEAPRLPMCPIRSPALLTLSPRTTFFSGNDGRTAVYSNYELVKLRPKKMLSHLSTIRQADFYFNGKEIHAKTDKLFRPVGLQYYRRRAVFEAFVKLLNSIISLLPTENSDSKLQQQSPASLRSFTVKKTSTIRLTAKSTSPRPTNSRKV